MYLSSLRYKPIEGGTLGGHFAIHVTLGGGDSAESLSLDENALARKIHDAYTKLGLSPAYLKGVLIDTRNAPNLDANEMVALMSALRDWNYYVGIWVDGTKRCSWYSLANYIVAFVSTENWANFKCNEIRYVPYSGNFVEPDIYDVNANTPCYVDTTDNAQALIFITTAKRSWGIIAPPRTYPVVDFTE
jgi:hypothetical protein